MGNGSRRLRVPITLAVTCGLLVALPVGPASAKATKAATKPLSITVLSTRADLVSDGDALVGLGGVRTLRGVTVRAGRRDVTRAFKVTAAGVRGLVTDLPLGRTTLTARTRTRGARLTLVNHPRGGPVFAGPQLQPWVCQPGATDAQCNAPTSFRFVYRSTNPTKGGFQAYDPASPPSDVATTTTESGAKVPFVVRIETGYLDRDQYAIATLFDPAKPWTAVDPQPQFNHKLLITHGAACGNDHRTGSAPDVLGGAAPTALGLGYATMSTALDNSGHNCTLPVQAESLVMTKEHLVDRYGTLRYTIGTGCSGGSLAEQWVANAYPGVYQGILPTCSFPDAWSTATQFLDYHQTLAYFTDPARWGPGVAWLPTQMASVQGHVTIVNSEVSDNAQFHVIRPDDPCAGVTAEQRFDTQRNPGGVRCSIADAAINVFGPRLPATWSPQERQIGRGFAGVPVDNVGVQYGLRPLLQGQITPAMFADLNAKIGGVSHVDVTPVPERIEADRPALANAYRSGSINETNNLDQTAIIDCRGPDPAAFHDAYRAFAVRGRLDREHGGHANQAIWEGPVEILGDLQCETNAFLAMNRWLAAVEQDSRPGTVAEKVARDKPADITDRCYSGVGQKLTDDLCGQAVVATYATPRVMAGDAITTDTNKCVLKPLDRTAYGAVTFTDAEWASLQRSFPSGVCDFSKPGVDQQGTIPWQTYQDAAGKVIYGGRRLGAVPRSRTVRVARDVRRRATR